MESITLEWHGPFPWLGDGSDVIYKRPEAKKKGVYLWTIPLDNEFLTFYVGQTGKGEANFAARFKVSERGYVNGMQRVYDSRLFTQGILNKPYLLDYYLRRDKKGIADHKAEFNRRRSELQPHIDKIMRAINFFVSDNIDDERLRKRVEAFIYYRLSGTPGKVRMFLDEGITNFSPRRDGESEILVKMKFPKPIMGLGENLEVKV